ncbi:MAG: DNA repair protein RecO [Bacteroidota bacterium]
MLIKTRGIVLRSFKYSETSLICEVYTERAGLKKYIVSGVRHKKAKVSANLLQIMSLIELVAYNKEGRDLHRPKEIKPFHLYQKLPFDIVRSSVGMFITEVAQKILREDEENAPIFQFLLNVYLHLDQTTQPVGNIHLYFLAHFTKYLGFVPDGEYNDTTPYFHLEAGTFQAFDAAKSTLNQQLSRYLDLILQSDLQTVHQISIGKAERHSLLNKLLLYYQTHLENLPNISAHHILRDVLE